MSTTEQQPTTRKLTEFEEKAKALYGRFNYLIHYLESADFLFNGGKMSKHTSECLAKLDDFLTNLSK